jgi:2-polyprenyl-3-methyl-5-hydroxy-6-metoxy-1,4-benzoquinol methylase
MLNLPPDFDRREIMSPRKAFIIKKMCENFKEGTILDVGCGNGKQAQHLGSIGVNIYGVDIDENEIKRATDSNKYENVEFACQDIKDITDIKYPGILLSEVLEHTAEPLEFLNELYRLCEDDGFLIITVPHGYCLKETLMAGILFLKKNKVVERIVKWYKDIIGRNEEYNDSPHLQRFTLKKIQPLFEKSGFTIKEFHSSDILMGFFWMYLPWLPIPYFMRRFERNITKYFSYKLLGDYAFVCVKKTARLNNLQ